MHQPVGVPVTPPLIDAGSHRSNEHVFEQFRYPRSVETAPEMAILIDLVCCLISGSLMGLQVFEITKHQSLTQMQDIMSEFFHFRNQWNIPVSPKDSH
jgi:hypothetical protein